MKRAQAEVWELCLMGFTAQEALDFISKTERVLLNCEWRIRAPYAEKQTHNIVCELPAGDFKAARENLEKIAVSLNVKISNWKLTPIVL